MSFFKSIPDAFWWAVVTMVGLSENLSKFSTKNYHFLKPKHQKDFKFVLFFKFFFSNFFCHEILISPPFRPRLATEIWGTKAQIQRTFLLLIWNFLFEFFLWFIEKNFLQFCLIVKTYLLLSLLKNAKHSV